jgi:hypothetical protein
MDVPLQYSIGSKRSIWPTEMTDRIQHRNIKSMDVVGRLSTVLVAVSMHLFFPRTIRVVWVA